MVVLSCITVSAGDLTGTASFTPTDDSVMKEMKPLLLLSHLFQVLMLAESGTQSVTITITENESAPTVTLSTSANSIAENAGSSLTLTATLSLLQLQM